MLHPIRTTLDLPIRSTFYLNNDTDLISKFLKACENDEKFYVDQFVTETINDKKVTFNKRLLGW